MLKIDIDILLAEASALEGETKGIDYRTRVAVERAIFRTAKAIANRHFLLNLSGFSLSSRMDFMEAARANRSQIDARFCLDLAFELTAALASLASGDAYVRKELILEAVPGRLSAISLFSRKLRRYADEVARLRVEDETASPARDLH